MVLLMGLILAKLAKSKLITTCELPKLKLSTSDLIINFQQSLLNNLALDDNYALMLLKFEEKTDLKPYKAMFQIVNAKYEAFYIGVIFRIKSERPVFDTFIQSKHKGMIADILGFGKYTESVICPDFKPKMKDRFLKFMDYLYNQNYLNDYQGNDDVALRGKRKLNIEENLNSNLTKSTKNHYLPNLNVRANPERLASNKRNGLLSSPKPPKAPTAPTIPRPPNDTDVSVSTKTKHNSHTNNDGDTYINHSSSSHSSSKEVKYSHSTEGDSEQSVDTRDLLNENKKEQNDNSLPDPTENTTIEVTNDPPINQNTISPMIKIKVKTVLKKIWGFEISESLASNKNDSETEDGSITEQHMETSKKRMLSSGKHANDRKDRRNYRIYKEYINNTNY